MSSASTTGRSSRRRRADAERSIEAILDAAAACFRANPDTTMADIARAAGVGRVTLYTHYPSRDVLLEAVVDRAIADTGAALDAALSDDEPAEEALRRIIHTSWEGVDRAGRLVEAAKRTLGSDRLRQRHAPAMDHIERLIAKGRQEGVFRRDLPSGWLVTVCYSLFHAAAEDIAAGRLDATDAPAVLEATLLPALRGG